MTDDPVIQIPPHVIAAIKECAIFSATERAKGNMCCLHVALDDGNVKNENIDFCVEEDEREEHPECLRMARVLQDLSETERDVVYYLFGLWEEQQPGPARAAATSFVYTARSMVAAHGELQAFRATVKRELESLELEMRCADGDDSDKDLKHELDSLRGIMTRLGLGS